MKNFRIEQIELFCLRITFQIERPKIASLRIQVPSGSLRLMIDYSSSDIYDPTKMNCISRRDHSGRNIFVQERKKSRRWNLFSQIAIENTTLKCANETYFLTEPIEGQEPPIPIWARLLCNDRSRYSQPCTLLDTNELVDLGYHDDYRPQ